MLIGRILSECARLRRARGGRPRPFMLPAPGDISRRIVLLEVCNADRCVRIENPKTQNPMPIMPPNTALAGSYDYRLVALSVLIAMLASYAALDLGGRVTAARGRLRSFW